MLLTSSGGQDDEPRPVVLDKSAHLETCFLLHNAKIQALECPNSFLRLLPPFFRSR